MQAERLAEELAEELVEMLVPKIFGRPGGQCITETRREEIPALIDELAYGIALMLQKQKAEREGRNPRLARVPEKLLDTVEIKLSILFAELEH